MTVKGAFYWQILANVSNLFFSFTQIAILSRSYNISEFGLLAVIMVIMNLCQVFSNLGMSNYLIYRSDNSKLLNSTVFYSMVISSCLFSLVLYYLAPYIAMFYNRPRLIYLIEISSLCIIAMSLFMQLQACYIKFGKIALLAKCEIISRLFSFILVMLLFYFGGNIQIIIWGMIANFLFKFLLLIFFAQASWRPSFYFSVDDFRKARDYGVYQIGSQFLNQLRMNLDIILLGLYLDDSTLGLYNLAKQLVNKPSAFINPIVSRISLRTFSSSHHVLSDFKSKAVDIHRFNVALITGSYLLMALCAPFICLIFYGQGNLEVAYYLYPLALFWGVRYSNGALVGPLAQSLGKTRREFIWNLIGFLVFLFITYIFCFYKLIYLCWAYLIIQLVLSSISFFVFIKPLALMEIKIYINPILKFYCVSIFLLYINSFYFSENFDIYNNFFINVFIVVFLYFLLSYKYIRSFLNSNL